jgi:hypothetical protein
MKFMEGIQQHLNNLAGTCELMLVVYTQKITGAQKCSHVRYSRDALIV